MKTIAGLFDNLDAAHAAVRDLRELGLPSSDVSLVAHDVTGTYTQSLNGADWATTTPVHRDATATGAGMGAVLGGLAGLMVGLGALVLPGIGPVLAAGPLATVLSGIFGVGMGAVSGGLAGGLLGALVDLGVPEDQAHYYAEGVRRGGALVTVNASDDQAEAVRGILSRHYAVDVERRAADWRANGWTGYSPTSEPYTGEQVAAERRIYGLAESVDPASRYDDDESYFRRHYDEALAATGRDFDVYRPAYVYGQTLRADPRYKDYDWERVEPDAQREWETRYPNNTWADFKLAVRTAWENVKATIR